MPNIKSLCQVTLGPLVCTFYNFYVQILFLSRNINHLKGWNATHLLNYNPAVDSIFKNICQKHSLRFFNILIYFDIHTNIKTCYVTEIIPYIGSFCLETFKRKSSNPSVPIGFIVSND